MAHASISYNNLTDDDIVGLMKDTSAVLNHTPVMGALPLSEEFGIATGLVLSTTSIPNIEDTVVRETPSAEVNSLPSASLLFVGRLPKNWTAEVSYLPEVSIGTSSLKLKALAFKKTLPKSNRGFDLGLRVQYTKSTLATEQDVAGAPARIKLREQIVGLGAVASNSFLYFEPYIGVNYLYAMGKMSINGDSEVFTFTDAKSVSKNVSGYQLYSGIQVNYQSMQLGFEAGKIFDSMKATLKISAVY